MTILTAMQSAAARLVSRRPSTFFSTQNAFEIEITDLVTETAKDIVKSHDWQALLKLHTIPGNGVATSFSLPTDYDRMPIKGDVHSSTILGLRFVPARDLDQFLDVQSGISLVTPGVWVLLGGAMQFWPAPASGDVAKFYYVSSEFARDEDGVAKSSFTDDNDSFVLDERLLTLGLIWRWRAQKRLEYSEDMANYEKALAENVGRDKGSRVLAVGSSRLRANVTTAFPGQLG